MSVLETELIDFIHEDPGANVVSLTVADHMEWKDQNEEEHLWLLQEKLNTYLRFIESGELNQSFPLAMGKTVHIRIVGKFPLQGRGLQFFDSASRLVENAGFKLSFQLLEQL